jgi:hypothetical protein
MESADVVRAAERLGKFREPGWTVSPMQPDEIRAIALRAIADVFRALGPASASVPLASIEGCEDIFFRTLPDGVLTVSGGPEPAAVVSAALTARAVATSGSRLPAVLVDVDHGPSKIKFNMLLSANQARHLAALLNRLAPSTA